MNLDSIRVLLVEDDDDDARLVEIALRGTETPCFCLKRARSVTEAKHRLANGQYDVILSDLGLPDGEGLSILEVLTSIGANIPIVLLTRIEDTELALDALNCGAQDYLPKGQIEKNTLPRAICHAIQRHQLVGQLHEMNDSLRRKNARLAELYLTAQNFVDNVSHEFRTPLTVIREFTALVGEGIDGPVNERQQQRLSAVLNRTDDLAIMVDDLLDVGRLESGLLRVWRSEHGIQTIFDQVKSTLDRRASSKQIDLSFFCENELPDVFCDDEKVRRIIINLTVNAIKFSSADSNVRVHARTKDEKYVTVEICDEGPGINTKDLRNIFERFEQGSCQNLRTSCKGFGLGLNIARELVILNFGQLQVSSEIGRGSTFSFTLPIANPKNVVECYLDQRTAQADVTKNIGIHLAEANVDDENTRPTIDDFLHHAIRSRDLAIGVQENKWMILSCSSPSESEEIHERLSAEYETFKANCPRNSSPRLKFEKIGEMHAETQRQEVLDLLANVSVPPAIPRSKVLIVDDELDVRTALSVRLDSEGIDVVLAHDAKTGLAAAKESDIDAILLDIRMPGMDGIEVLRRLKSDSTTQDVPVLMLSASLRDQQITLDQGARFFIQKPYNSQTVVSALRLAIGQKRPLNRPIAQTP